jgi:hypothetical protein
MLTRGNFEEILINYPAIAQFGAVALITKCLRNFSRGIGVVSIYYPANAQAGTGLLIMNGLQRLDWPRRRFPYTIRQKFNQSHKRALHD